VRRFAILFLLLCATAHCVLSIFYVNLSYLDLPRYIAGHDHLPFQRRLLMIPFLRWAQGSHLLQQGAARYGKFVNLYEPMTAAKLACMLLGVVLLIALGLLTVRLSPRLGIRHRWLVWALMLVILYASYAARSEQALWYPYDIPHLALFGAATLFLLTEDLAPFAACMAVDIFVRETSLFLLLLALLLRFRSTARAQPAWRYTLAALFALWIFSRWLGQHLYPNNLFQPNAVPWYRMAAPWHWPQLLSIVGFLWIPVWLGKRYLSQTQRLALYGASALMLATFFFATWNETRAWSEWTVLFAILAATELETAFAQPPGGTAVVPSHASHRTVAN
jgi:hypothetical protein